MIKNMCKNLGGKKIVVLWISLIFVLGAIIPSIGSKNIIKESADSKNIMYFNIIEQEKPQSNSIPLLLGAGAPWWNTDWQHRKEITINHSKVSASLTNIPILINLNPDDDLANNAQDDGDDIVLIDDGSNQLNHEIEYFNGSTGELVCWVNITSLSSTEDTTIYIYYGNLTCSSQQNADNVWDSKFVMVQHLNEISDTHYDSTSYGNNGLPQGALNQNATGKVDGADEFDGVDDHINCGNDSSLSISDMLSLEAWVNYTEVGNSIWRGVVTKNDYNDWAFAVGGTEAPGKAVIYITGETWEDSCSSGDVISTSTINDGLWHHIVATYDGNTTRIYVDGIEEANSTSLTGPIHTSTLDLLIGDYENLARIFKGSIDEVRVSNTARNSDWIKTEYNNQHNPGTFYNVSNEETSNIKPTANFTYSPENPSTQDVIQFTDTSTDPDGAIVSWFWEFDDGNTSTEQNPTHQYTEEGIYNVSLTATDDDDATDEISKEITIGNAPPTANFTYTPENPTTQDTIQFTDTSTDPDGTITSWLWDFNDGNTSTQQNPTHQYTDDGTYEVSLTVSDDDGETNTISKEIEIADNDTIHPVVNIIKPKKALYILNLRIRPFIIRKPLIIGRIDIEVDALDEESGISKVEFYIDGKLKTNITTPPYTYTWKRDRIRIFGHRHKITVTAYDNAGNCASDEIKVWKFL